MMKTIIKIILLLIKNRKMLKNFNFKEDWKTSLTGLIGVVILILGQFNVITPDQGEGLKEGAISVIDSFAGNASDIIQACCLFVVTLITMFFAKDSKKKNNTG